jgi:DNA-binding protein YbaB
MELGPMPVDMDEAQRRLDEWKARMESHAAQLQAANEELAAVTTTYTDPNGVVTVTVDSGGNLTELVLSNRVQRQAPEVTARQITEALAAAKQQVAQMTTEVATRHFGADSPTTKALADHAKSSLGTGQE